MHNSSRLDQFNESDKLVFSCGLRPFSIIDKIFLRQHPDKMKAEFSRCLPSQLPHAVKAMQIFVKDCSKQGKLLKNAPQ